MRFTIIGPSAATLALLLGQPLLAKEASQQPPSEKDTPDENRKVCKKFDVTGSLVQKRKLCKTAAEWREMNERGNRAARDILENAPICVGDASCRGG